MTSGFKDIGFRQSEFVEKTQFLIHFNFFLHYSTTCQHAQVLWTLESLGFLHMEIYPLC